jgi:hypothetical protein
MSFLLGFALFLYILWNMPTNGLFLILFIAWVVSEFFPSTESKILDEVRELRQILVKHVHEEDST